MSNESIFSLIGRAEGDLRTSMISNLAAVRRITVEALEAEFTTFQKDNAVKLEKERKKQEREDLKVRLTALNTEAEGMALDSEGLGDFVGRVIADGGVVSLTPELGLTVTLPTVRKGGTGGGKPAKDAPRPYVIVETGERLVGAVTDFVDANFDEAEQKKLGLFRPNGIRRAGQALVKPLVAAKVLENSPIPTEEVAEEVE